MTPHPHLPSVPGTETLASFMAKGIRSRSCSLRFIPDEQTSISDYDDQEQANKLAYSNSPAERLRWVEALKTTYLTQRLSLRLDRCGTNAWVERCTATSKYRVVSPACKLRFCPRCAHIHAQRTHLRLKTWATDVEQDDALRLRLVTLTIRSTNAPLKHQLDFLYRSYRKLRQRALWKKTTNGAIAVLQVTYNAATKQWHPHLHVVQHGRFIDWHRLKSTWSKITHGSDGVDIRPVRDAEKACDYVCRYVARPLENDPQIEPARLVEYVMATKGRRLLIASGNAPLIMPDKEPDDHEWIHVDSLAGLLARVRQGDPEAERILAEIHASAPVPPDQELMFFDDFLDDDDDPPDDSA